MFEKDKPKLVSKILASFLLPIWWMLRNLLPNPFHIFSAYLWNCFLCWDCWNGDVTPTLDTALLFSSKAGSDLGHV